MENWLKSLGKLKFHVPGGLSSMRCTPQHLQRDQFRVLFGEDFFEYSFMTVRNPFTRIESEYRMRAEMSGRNFFKTFANFSRWLENNIAQAQSNIYHLDNHIRPQWHFCGSGLQIFKLEDGLENILSTVAAEIGAPPPQSTPHLLQTSEKEIPVTWDRVDILRVLEFYSKDFEEFGYPKDPPVDVF